MNATFWLGAEGENGDNLTQPFAYPIPSGVYMATMAGPAIDGKNVVVVRFQESETTEDLAWADLIGPTPSLWQRIWRWVWPV